MATKRTPRTPRKPQDPGRVVNRKANEVEGEEATDYRFTIKEAKFIDNITSGMYIYKAYEAAGYKPGHRENASTLKAKKHIKDELDRRFKLIRESVTEILEAKASRAAEISAELMESSTPNDSVRLRAAHSFLDRTGHTAKQYVEVDAKVEHKISVTDYILGMAEDEDEVIPPLEDSENVTDSPAGSNS